jgi:hypothetical protein
MESSIANQKGGKLARLEGLRNAIDLLLEEAARLSNLAPGVEPQASMNIFIYAFGMRLPGGAGVCDLLRLFDAVRVCEPYARELAEDYERRLRADERKVAIELMGWGASDLLHMSRADAEKVLRARIQERVTDSVMSHIHKRAAGRSLKDLTVDLASMMERWSKYRESMAIGNSLFGGNTPMRECLAEIRARFERERSNHPQCSRFILLIVSDGAPSDGDPRPAALEVKASGVSIVSCFVAPDNLAGTKQLHGRPGKSWSNGAKIMFDMATTVSVTSPEVRYLVDRGWKLEESSPPFFPELLRHLRGRKHREESAHLFAQVNHSEHLHEFMQVILAPLRLERESEK